MPKPPSLLAYIRRNRMQLSHAIDEFVGWYCSEVALSFNKTVVTRYRVHLEDRRLRRNYECETRGRARLADEAA